MKFREAAPIALLVLAASCGQGCRKHHHGQIPQAPVAYRTYPDMADVVAPSPAPAWPDGFDAFAPPVDASTPAAGAPAIAEFTRMAGPGDSLVLSGSRLSAYSGADAGRDTRFTIYGQSAAGVALADAAILRLSGDLAAITLPANLPSWSTYFLWPANANDYGRPVLINRTEAWWVGPDQAARGERFAVHGRNLASGDGESKSWIYLQPAAGGPGQWLAGVEVNPCRVAALVPADLANGSYKVWAHNGHGGAYGWSGPLDLTVNDGPGWTGVSFDVTAYGAKPDDGLDDSAGISAAINAASNSAGSTVIFPAGVFHISTHIDVRSDVRFKGAGMDSTQIRCLPNYGSGGNTYGMLFHNGGSGNFTCEDMTFDTDGHFGGNIGTICYIRFAQDLRLTRVRFTDLKQTSSYRTPLDIHGSNRVRLTGCEFVQSEGNFFGTTDQVLVEGCRFIGHRDANSLVYIWGGSQFSFTGCSAQDYDTASATGQGKGRFISGAGLWGPTRDLYFGGNTTHDLTPRDDPGVDQNSGEQFMWEALDTDWRGAVSTAGASDVTCPSLGYDPSDSIAVVVAGAGLGQSRRISGWDAAQTKLTVDQPWQVRPDSTSVLSIGRFLSRVGVYGNAFDGKPRAPASPTHIASSGVQPFGGSQDLVVRRNTFHELRCAISNWSMSGGSDPQARWTQPNFFNLFTDNRIEACRWAISQIHADWDGVPTVADYAILAAVYRKNTVTGNVDGVFGSSSPSADRIQFTLYDLNTADRGTQGFNIGQERDAVLVGNAMARGSAADSGGVAMSAASRPCLRDNTWDGFAAAYTGTQPGGVLENPWRVFELSAPAGGQAAAILQIWNAGTAALSWTVSSNAPWLTPAPAAGSVADERGASPVTLTADAAGLSAGLHEAVVTVGANGQSQRATVRLTVIPPP